MRTPLSITPFKRTVLDLLDSGSALTGLHPSHLERALRELEHMGLVRRTVAGQPSITQAGRDSLPGRA